MTHALISADPQYGLDIVRQNFTHVECASSHATSFALRASTAACSFCHSTIPARFLALGTEITFAGWTLLAGLFFTSVLAGVLHALDRTDWKHVGHNLESYFVPHRPVKRSRWISQLGVLRRRPPARKNRAAATKIGMAAFSDARPAASAVLTGASASGGRQLVVRYPLIFRVGSQLTVNGGGSTEERGTVSKFTPSTVVLRDSLLHAHHPGERVTQQESREEVGCPEDDVELEPLCGEQCLTQRWCSGWWHFGCGCPHTLE